MNRAKKIFFSFCLATLLMLLLGGCQSGTSNAEEDKGIVLAFSNDNHGEVAPCG